jgi:hypothetical protein
MTWISLAERLLTGAALGGGAIYVLINALYIEFYDDFGVRPEQVGLDRLAVLGRVAWIALIAIAMAGAAGWLFTLFSVRRRRDEMRASVRAAEAAAQADRPDPVPPEPAQQLDEQRQQLRQSTARLQRSRAIGIAVLAATAILLAGYWYLQGAVETEADRVRRGESVNGLSFVVPFIDLPVNRANVTWLGDQDQRPDALDSPHLMYLGRGPDVAVFLACGRETIVVPADDVAVIIQRDTSPPDRNQTEQRRQLTQACR